jgi:hypothetical protein
MKTRKVTIDKYQIAIQEIVDLIKSKNGKVIFKEMFEIARKNRISWTCVDGVLKTKIVEKTNVGLFKVNVDKIEPIHARKVIELKNTTQVMNRKKPNKKNVKKEVVKKEEIKEPLLKQTRFLGEKENNKKTISIFWGLIKINY